MATARSQLKAWRIYLFFGVVTIQVPLSLCGSKTLNLYTKSKHTHTHSNRKSVGVREQLHGEASDPASSWCSQHHLSSLLSLSLYLLISFTSLTETETYTQSETDATATISCWLFPRKLNTNRQDSICAVGRN